MSILCENLKKTQGLSRAKQMTKDLLNNNRSWFMGFYTRRQIVEVYDKPLFKGKMKKHDDTWRNMETLKTKKMQKSDEIAQRMAEIARSDQGGVLSETLLDGTVNKVFPHQETVSDIPTMNPEQNARRRQAHKKARENYKKLTPKNKKLYKDILKDLNLYFGEIEAQIKKNLDNLPDRAGIQEAKLKIREEFENEFKYGIYFPLSRFGEWVGIATKTDPKTKKETERIVTAFESKQDLNKFIEEHRGKGFNVDQTFKGKYRVKDHGPSSETVRQIFKALDDAGLANDTELKDEINQLFLKALPDVSYRKHFIHRKNVLGFSKDITRAYSHATFHAANHLGNLKYKPEMNRQINELKKFAKDDLKGDNKTIGEQVVQELERRIEVSTTNNISPFVHWLGSLGFVWNIGPSLSSAMVNLTQVPLFTGSYLGAQKKVGFVESGKLLMDAYNLRRKSLFKDGKLTLDISNSSDLTKNQRDMIKRLMDGGVIDVSQAQDLAGLSQLDFTDRYKSKSRMAWYKVQRGVSLPFHVAEVFNRQVAALASYNAATKKMGLDHEAAIKFTIDAVYDTQLDYSTSNRARFMQGNVRRIVFMFKQYSQGATFILGKTFRDILRGETPEIKAQATKYMAGILGGHFAVAGAMGLPLYGVGSMLIEAFINGVSDDNDPFDFDAWFRNSLANIFGTKGGEVIARGMSRLGPADVSTRMNLDLMDLWFKPPQQYLEGRKMFDAYFLGIRPNGL